MPDTEKAKKIIGSVASTVADRLSGAVGSATERVGHRSGSAQQTVTIAKPAGDVAAAWRDAETLSRVLGELGHVVREPSGRYRWVLEQGGEKDPVVWPAVLVEEPPSQPSTLRFVDADGDAGAGATDAGTDGSHTAQGSEVVLELRTAPQDLGTEATLRLDLPVPSLAAGALALTLLYRTRSLLQTGEIATISPQPSARQSDR